VRISMKWAKSQLDSDIGLGSYASYAKGCLVECATRALSRPAALLLCVGLLMLVPVGVSAQQCLPEDIVSLAKAGYSHQEIDGICQVSGSFFARSGRADLSTDAMARFMNSVMPIEIDGANSTKLLLRGLKYCKADNEHRAELLGYGTAGSGAGSSGGQPTVVEPSPFENADCNRPLAVVSKRVIDKNVSHSSNDFVARVILDWVPWELRLGVAEIKGSGNAVPKAATFPTNVIPVTIGNQVVAFSAAFYFFNDSVSVMLVPSVDVAQVSDLSYIPKLSSLSAFGAQDATASADARVRVTHRATNYLLDTYFSGNQSLIVDTGNQAIGNLTVKQLHGESSGVERYTVSGVVYDNNGGSYSTKISSQGTELGLDAIEIEAKSLKTCPPPSLGDINSIQCNAANAALQGGASLLSSVLTSAYRGKQLKTFGSPDTLHLTLGRIACNVDGVVKHVGTTDKYLQIDATLSFKHP
jgi:hypothetical protein